MATRFPALSHPQFRSFWLAQSLSLVGSWMQNISLPWLAYDLTGSAFLLGLLGAFQYLPSLLLSMPAGVLVDRHRKRPLVIISQAVSGLGSLAITVLLFLGVLNHGNAGNYVILVGLALVLGLAQCLDFPARQAYMLELVGKKDLTNSVALNSSSFNAARIIGPALAGLIMASLGIRYCFLINTLSFIPVLVVLIALGRWKQTREIQEPGEAGSQAEVVPADQSGSAGPAGPAAESMGKAIREGLSYVLGHRTILKVMASTALMGIFALNFSVIIPVKVKEIFGGQETTYGYLMSFMGIGSLGGALFLALRRKPEPLYRLMPLFSVMMALVLLGQGFASDFWSCGILLVLSGFFGVGFFTTATSTLQFFSAHEYRGRVLALYSLCFGGMGPLGSLVSGAACQGGGSVTGLLVTGGAILLGTAGIEVASRIRNRRLAELV